MTWTRFMDMHSGGGQKLDWPYIYIEAPEGEAKRVFYHRFGRNPERVTCTCCGDDYAISTDEDLAQLTAYDRRCRYIEDVRGWQYRGDDKLDGRYIEEGDNVPTGFVVSSTSAHRYGQGVALDVYLATVKVIRADEISASERAGDVPDEGYVWVGDSDA